MTLEQKIALAASLENTLSTVGGLTPAQIQAIIALIVTLLPLFVH